MTVVISAFTLAQPGRSAITTTELPPPGVQAPAKPAPSPETKSAPAAPEAPVSPAPKQDKPAAETAAPGSDSGDTQTAQPTAEEKQSPTAKQAGGTGSPGRVAAFWFVLPSRPPANKQQGT